MNNPLLSEWQTPHQLPPYDLIKTDHYLPAFEQAFTEHNVEIEAIVNHAETPTFANTIEALELSGSLLSRISPVFYVLNSAHTNDALTHLQSVISPKLTVHYSAINSRKELFARVKAVYESAPELDHEQQVLLNQTYKDMVRDGAALSDAERNRVQSIDEQLSVLETTYGQNILKEANNFKMVLDSENDLAGLPQSVRDNAAKEAEDQDLPGKYLFTISRSSFTPFLQFSERRELREKMWRAYTQCANNKNGQDNKAIALDIAGLRAERAAILGYQSHAEFTLDDRMAATPAKVNQLLDQLWAPAKSKVNDENIALQECIQREGGNFTVAPWDWWFYTEKVRQDKFDLDTEVLKPYFELSRVRQGAFDVANKLYGITFTAIADFPSYHEDVEAFEVKEKDGQLIGLFLTDYFMRPSKRSGAWMNAFRSQRKFDTAQTPIILNTCNFPKGSPALLGPDEVRTLFHEFGHALHGLLSNVTYRSLSGTSVKRDFVELPSQIMEHWAVEPEVLRSFARHYQTNEIIPDELISKILETRTFNQGFATTEYLAASYLDMKWHELTTTEGLDVETFENQAMQDIELVDQVAPRYRSTYFQHIFSGGYSAGYYSYIWAEVLDADAFEEFKTKGIFDTETAESFRRNILERGGTDDPMNLYKKFKGREPNVKPLMASRGLLD